ncbi:uncharacterized protein LOC115680206 [Syzygium oleosum]|uniref:uncharacterized protein LOC115680206 n=1 Tax=Syzygium oleosum TaxID=219896 RepID=UPI0024B90F87|nr:uncharacterized protein LOC115680206 [Syzygium oleosum]
MATVAGPSAAALSSGRIVKPVWRVRNVQEARVFAAEFEPDSWRIPIESAPEPAYPFGAKAEARLLEGVDSQKKLLAGGFLAVNPAASYIMGLVKELLFLPFSFTSPFTRCFIFGSLANRMSLCRSQP